jgi:hypothetical protein
MSIERPAAAIGQYPLLARDVTSFLRISHLSLRNQIEADKAPQDTVLASYVPAIAFDCETATVAPMKEAGFGYHLIGPSDHGRSNLALYLDAEDEEKLVALETFEDITSPNAAYDTLYQLHEIISDGDLRYFGYDSGYSYRYVTEPIPGLAGHDGTLVDHDLLVTRACMTTTMFAAIKDTHEYDDILPAAFRQYELLRSAGNRPLGPEELSGMAYRAVRLLFTAYKNYRSVQPPELTNESALGA